jgi:hypothetical protein
MPSKEENLAEERMVDEPSQSEINDAIRSISSAFAVIRAVQKYVALSPSYPYKHQPYEADHPSNLSAPCRLALLCCLSVWLVDSRSSAPKVQRIEHRDLKFPLANRRWTHPPSP